MTDLRIQFYGKHADAYPDLSRELNIEGAIRSGKTTLCLWREREMVVKHPGIHVLFARWTDSGVYGLVLPLWRQLCEQSGIKAKWHADEEYEAFENGSRVYVRGLKSQDQTLRYSKLRGYTVARVYIDQAEEVPQDVYLEAAGRLSQPGYPHQITISPQSVAEDHWIAKEFPEDNRHAPHRRLYQLAVHDNAHNLDPSVIPALERLYPPEHPQHRTLILGRRGLNVIGEPVYKAAFDRRVHEGVVEFDPRLELQMALDFGKHHPCVLFRQVSALGQLRYLGGILGQDLYLDDFLGIVLEHRAQWFPRPVSIRECCDPAGTSDTSHGTEGAIRILRAKGIHPVSRPDANTPTVRLAAIERMAAQMRQRAADRSEKFLISDSDRWIRVSAHQSTIDRFYADGCEAGYVWSPHMVSVGNKQVRVPKKDGWYEHAQNCAEYLEITFGEMRRAKTADDPVSVPTLPRGSMGWMGG